MPSHFSASPIYSRGDAGQPSSDRLPPLGGNTQEVCAHGATEAERELLREANRGCTTKSARSCGHLPKRRLMSGASGREKDVKIVASVDAKGRRRASFRGAVFCKSAFACPVCLYRRRTAAAADLKRVVADWRAGGGGVYMLSLTIRHRRQHKLRKQVQLIRAAWRAFTHSRAYKRVIEDLGISHVMHSLEATYGAASGWHPHVHALLLARPEGGSTEHLTSSIESLRNQWLLAVQAATAKVALPERARAQYVPSAAEGAKLTVMAGTGDYIVKMGLGEAHAPTSEPVEGRSPWAIMLGAAGGTQQDRCLWKEFTDAMRGQHLVHGLGDAVKSVVAPARPVAVPRRPETVVAAIPATIYRGISRIPGALPRVLRGAEDQGLRGVALSVAADLLGVVARDPTCLPREVQRLIRLFNPMGPCAHPSTWRPGGGSGSTTLRQLRRARLIAVGLERRRARRKVGAASAVAA